MSTLAGLVLIDCLVWAGWSLVVGVGASRLADATVDRDRWLLRIRPVERSGRLYERFAIRRWKDALPDAGTWFGGLSKRRTGGREALPRYAGETRRAELVHWAVLALTPFFVLWNPLGLFAAMVAYGVLANIPCIAIQRYNRARIERVLQRRVHRSIA